MKKFLYLIFSICMASTSQAQSMRDIWINMPDSMTEYLTKSQRTEMADYVAMHEPLSAQNALSGSSVIDTLTTDFIQVHASASQVIQIKRLPMLGKDSIICLNRIFYGPEPESDALVGVDATVAEGWKDFCVRNDTKMTFQIGIAFDDNNIIGTVFASDDPRCQYVVKNENLHYAKAGDAVTETVDVIRNTIDPHTGKLLSHDLIYQNRCLIGYETDLSL